MCEEHLGEALIAEVPATDSILKFLKTPEANVGAKYQDETMSLHPVLYEYDGEIRSALSSDR